jgi:hypothetical protein
VIPAPLPPTPWSPADSILRMIETELESLGLAILAEHEGQTVYLEVLP